MSPKEPPPCLLAYRISTAPSPMQVSSPSAASPAVIDVALSAPPGETVSCSRLVFVFPLGERGDVLCAHPPRGACSTSWWSPPTLKVVPGSELGLPGDSYAVLTSVSAPEHWPIDYDLRFSFTVEAVDQTVGAVGALVNEYSAPERTEDPTQLTHRRGPLALAKAPWQLYLNNLVALAKGSARPRSAFTNGEPIVVQWASNGASFDLYAGAAATPVYSGPNTSYTFEQGLARDTTLTAVAESPEPPAPSAALALQITNPDATPAKLAAGTLNVNGAATVKGSAALGNATVTGTLGASGATALAATSASSLSVSGQTALTGTPTLGNATFAGMLAKALATIASVTAGSMSIQSWVAMMKPQVVNPGSYGAHTDGILVGAVAWPSDPGTESMTFAWARGSGGFSSLAGGGNYLAWMSGKNFTMCNRGGAMAIPVRGGQGVSCGVQNVRGVQAPTQFLWVPFGSSSSLEALTQSQALALGLSGEPPPELATLVRDTNIAPRVREAVEATGAILGEALRPELRPRLADALSALLTPPIPPERSTR